MKAYLKNLFLCHELEILYSIFVNIRIFEVNHEIKLRWSEPAAVRCLAKELLTLPSASIFKLMFRHGSELTEIKTSNTSPIWIVTLHNFIWLTQMILSLWQACIVPARSVRLQTETQVSPDSAHGHNFECIFRATLYNVINSTTVEHCRLDG